MHTELGHLTFCTNIFPGESWQEHFDLLKSEIPIIKKQVAAESPFGIGLRLSNSASVDLIQPKKLSVFKVWLKENNCVVYTMNGFPYGSFHRESVKDRVHTPDWTTKERLDYSLRLFDILTELLPENGEGSISTSPLSYKYWFDEQERLVVKKRATQHIIKVVLALIKIYHKTGKVLHLDIEPEADGLLENSEEFIDWYLNDLLPASIHVLKSEASLTEQEADSAIRRHVQLCYDVCHFAVGFERVNEVVQRLDTADIQIGKWQLSAALKVNWLTESEENQKRLQELKKFDEPVYLHQVVAKNEKNTLLRYRDLPDAFHSNEALNCKEWRAHFHVPLFVKDYGLLESTQKEVTEALSIQKKEKQAAILEVETYTWDVLPQDLKQTLSSSIVRELKWVINHI